MKKIAVHFFAVALALANIGISPALAAGAATLSLSPTNISVKTGDSFSLSVAVSPSGESLDTARINLNWDASKLEALAFDLGSLFPNLSPSNAINNSAGTLSYGAFKFGTSVTSSGTIATVTFHALKSGTATVSVSADSKLISDGVEKLNGSSLGKATITISGSAVTSQAPATSGDTTPAPAATTAPSASTGTAPAANTEAAALKYYGALAGKLPSTSDEWVALKCMVNDACKAAKPDTEKEKKALALYTKKYKGLPKTSMEWNVIHAIAYTNVFIKWPASATPATPAAPATSTPAAATPATPATPAKTETKILSIQQQAVGWFGKLTGKLPSSDADWKAVNYMVSGYKPVKQDVDAESEAIALFSQKFGHLPSSNQDWNIIAAIAYSGAF